MPSVLVACIGNAIAKRNFLIWADDLGLNTAEWVYIFPKIRGTGLTSNSGLNDSPFLFNLFFVGYINQSFVDIWQNPTIFTDDGYNAKALATARRLFVVIVYERVYMPQAICSYFRTEFIEKKMKMGFIWRSNSKNKICNIYFRIFAMQKYVCILEFAHFLLRINFCLRSFPKAYL